MDFSDIDWTDVMGGFVILLVAAMVGFFGWYVYSHVTGIQEGYVYNKDFNAAGCNTTFMTISNGNTTTMTPITTCHGDTYTLWIHDEAEENTNWFEVPAVIYNNAELGDYYSSKCDCLRGKP